MKAFFILFLFSAILPSRGFAQVTYADLAVEGSLDTAKKCQKSLRKIYLSGSDLSSEIVKKMAIPLREWSSRKFPVGGTFYHYTDHPSYGDTIPRRDYDSIFRFFKTRPLFGCCGTMFAAGMYFANEPVSSKDYGKHLVVLNMKPSMEMIDGTLIQWPQIMAELKKNGFGEAVNNCDDLRALVLEDSGVDMIYYFHAIRPEGKFPWFILLNSRSILDSHFEMGK